MKFTIPQLDVSEDDGFKDDVLGRKAFGDALTSLVTKSSDELVISIDGRWGEGKTTFVKMWQKTLREQGVSSLYFDAFKNDYTDDAFVSLASAITTYVVQNSSVEQSKEFREKVTKVALRFLTWGAKTGAKVALQLATAGLDLEKLAPIKSEITSDAASSIAKFVSDRLSSHEADQNAISEFRVYLSDVPKKLNGNRSRVFVVIVDELDRCRPPFAVEVIEKIKHLFSVKNVVFVLVMNKDQLEEGIRCVYGERIDARTYLQKFIVIDASLPSRVNLLGGLKDTEVFVRNLINKHEFDNEIVDSSYICQCLSPVSILFGMTLREIERALTNVALMSTFLDLVKGSLVPIVVFVSVVKVSKPDIFNGLKNKTINYADLKDKISWIDSKAYGSKDDGILYIQRVLKFFLSSDNELGSLSKEDPVWDIQRTYTNNPVMRAELVSHCCNLLCMFQKT